MSVRLMPMHDDVPFEERFAALKVKLDEQFAEGRKN